MGKDILHLITYNQFFNQVIVDSFDRIYPERNQYLFCGTKKNAEVPTGDYISFFSKQFRSYPLYKYKLIIVHHLNFYKALLLNESKNKPKTIWICWGSDAFDLDVFRDKFLTKSTIKHFPLVRLKIRGFQYLQILHKYLFFRVNQSRVIYQSISNLDYIATLLPGDYELIKERITIKADNMDFNYYNTENYINTNSSTAKSFNVLVGNSSTLSNNHIDIINILKKRSTRFSGKLILPLVYGDKLYREQLMKHFRKAFDDQVMFLQKPVPSDEYYMLLQSCGFAIMNHLRQQALGNILPLISFGAKIFLNEEGQLFKYLRGVGFIVFSIQKDLSGDGAFNLLNEEEIKKNRNCLKKIRPSDSYESRMTQFRTLL